MKTKILLAVIGGICLLVWFAERQEGAESTGWPSVAGVVTDSSVTENRGNDGGVSREAHVAYTYKVDGRELQGTRLTVGPELHPAQETVARYPKGAQVQVFYDPKHPGTAVLEPGGSGSWLWLIGGVVFLLIAVWMKRQPKVAPPPPPAPA